MKDKDRIPKEEEIEKTMQSLDGIERAKTDDFFYARLQERLQNRKTSSTRFELKPALTLAVAAVLVLLVVNIFTIVQYQQYSSKAMEKTKELYLDVMAREYGLQVPTIYQLNDN